MEGWLEHKHRCFKFNQDLKTWQEANKECENKGAYLAVVDSEDVQEIVLKEVIKTKKNFWIGLSSMVIIYNFLFYRMCFKFYKFD